MKPADLDAILAGATDPAAATLARALREAWEERDGADRARRDADSRASQLALAVNARDRVLDLAATVLGWPPAPTPAEAIDAALATVAKIARLENDLRQLRESYPRAEVLRVLDAAGVEGVGIVDRVRELVSERDEWKRAAEKREVDGAALSSRLRADKATERQRAERAEQERDAALATVRTLNADIAAAAGELLVPIPTPGSDAARLLRANIILRQERDEARAERRAARLDRAVG